MFPGNLTSLSVPSHGLEATVRSHHQTTLTIFVFLFFGPFLCFMLKSSAVEPLSTLVFFFIRVYFFYEFVLLTVRE